MNKFKIVSEQFGSTNSFETYLARVITSIKKEGELETKYNIASTGSSYFSEISILCDDLFTEVRKGKTV